MQISIVFHAKKTLKMSGVTEGVDSVPAGTPLVIPRNKKDIFA